MILASGEDRLKIKQTRIFWLDGLTVQWEPTGVAAEGVTAATVEASAVQSRATVGVPALTPLTAKSDGPPTPDPVRDAVTPGGAPWPECLRGEAAVGFSLLLYEGGSTEDLSSCAESRDITALGVLEDGEYVSYILGAPDFVNRSFVELFGAACPR